MSGWSAITVEPKDVTEAELPYRNDIESLEGRLGDILDAYDDGDAGEVSGRLKRLSDEADELAKRTGDVDGEERVREYIKENYEYRGEPAILGWMSTPTFNPGDRHAVSGGEGYAETIFEECDYAKRVLIISANDTSDSGTGILFEREEPTSSTPVKVEKWQGYEGARGSDVEGYFAEEHGICGTSSVR